MKFIINRIKYQYGVVDLFIDIVKHELESKNHTVFEVDLGENTMMESFFKIFSEHSIDCVIAFNAVGCDIKYNNQSLYDVFNTNFLAILVDHPAHHIGRVIHPIKNYMISVIDKSHVKYISEILPHSHKLNFFLPHGGFENKQYKIRNLKEYNKQKNIDLLFTGSCFNKPVKPWEDLPKTYPLQLFDDICDLLIHDEYISVNEAYDVVFNKANIKLSTVSKAQMSGMIARIITYVRQYKRDLVLEKIFKSGINITICGRGWEDRVKAYDNVNYIGAIDVQESIELMSKAKIVINCNPNFTQGSHERVFTGMLNHAVVFTDRSSYFDEFYNDKDSLLYYSIDSIDNDILTLKEYIQNSSLLFDISSKAYNITYKNHLWKNRVKQIEEMVNLSNLIDL